MNWSLVHILQNSLLGVVLFSVWLCRKKQKFLLATSGCVRRGMGLCVFALSMWIQIPLKNSVWSGHKALDLCLHDFMHCAATGFVAWIPAETSRCTGVPGKCWFEYMWQKHRVVTPKSVQNEIKSPDSNNWLTTSTETGRTFAPVLPGFIEHMNCTQGWQNDSKSLGNAGGHTLAVASMSKPCLEFCLH